MNAQQRMVEKQKKRNEKERIPFVFYFGWRFVQVGIFGALLRKKRFFTVTRTTTTKKLPASSAFNAAVRQRKDKRISFFSPALVEFSNGSTNIYSVTKVLRHRMGKKNVSKKSGWVKLTIFPDLKFSLAKEGIGQGISVIFVFFCNYGL